ncbi:MAG: hypothetical protein R3C16_05030 [Hyphomonadaceae bacterium]
MRLKVISTALLAISLWGCSRAQPQTPLAGQGELSAAVTIGTRMCLRHVIDGVLESDLTHQPGTSELHYDVHGADVTRYRLDSPVAPEVTFLREGSCRVQIYHESYSDLVSVFDSLTRDWAFVGRPTGEYHPSRGADVLVVDARNYFEEDGFRAGTICVRGERSAIVQVAANSGVALDPFGGEAIRGTPELVINVSSEIRLENCPGADDPR